MSAPADKAALRTQNCFPECGRSFSGSSEGGAAVGRSAMLPISWSFVVVGQIERHILEVAVAEIERLDLVRRAIVIGADLHRDVDVELAPEAPLLIAQRSKLDSAPERRIQRRCRCNMRWTVSRSARIALGGGKPTVLASISGGAFRRKQAADSKHRLEAPAAAISEAASPPPEDHPS